MLVPHKDRMPLIWGSHYQENKTEFPNSAKRGLSEIAESGRFACRRADFSQEKQLNVITDMSNAQNSETESEIM